MDIKQAADVLGVSTATIRNWIHSGKITAVIDADSPRGKYSIDDAEVIKLLPEGLAPTSADNVTSDTSVRDTEQTQHVQRQWMIEAIKQAVQESFGDLAQGFTHYAEEQKQVVTGLSDTLHSLESELSLAMREVAATKQIVEVQQEQQQKTRDQQLMNSLQTIKERKRKRKFVPW